MRLVDVHCHLTEYKEKKISLDEILERLGDMDLVVTSGITPEDNRESLEIAKRAGCKNLFVTFGLNPVSLGRNPALFQEYMDSLVQDDCIVGIGEVGLDYYWEKDEKARARQREFFVRFIDLANDLGKVLVIHTRSAMKDTLDILESNTPDKFFIHSFRGSLPQARRVIDLGGFISLSTAMVRFPDAYRKLINNIPLEYILTETDSPYLAPVKGEINYPWNVEKSITFISREIGEAPEKVSRTIYKNAKSVLGVM